MRKTCFALLALTTAAGCASATPAEIQTELQSQSSMMLECPEEQVTREKFAGSTEPGKWSTHIAQGCGDERFITCFHANRLGCAEMPNLHERAAFELDCERENLELHALDNDGHLVGVSGCEQRVTYQYVRVSSTKSDWLLSSIRDQEGSPERPAATPPETNAQPSPGL